MSVATGNAYQSRENLDAMEHAVNYNAFLVGCILQCAGGRKLRDFGAGKGAFARRLAALGRDVTCVEPDPELRAGIGPALEAHAELAPIAPESFDAAYSLNVLEHIENDEKALRELAIRPRDGAVLVLYVPAFGLLYNAMDERVGHFRRYRRRPLERLLRRTGYAVVESRYVDSLGFFVALVYKLVGDRSGELSPRAVALYDRWVFPLSKRFHRLLGRVLGKNLLVVARKAASSESTPRARP